MTENTDTLTPEVLADLKAKVLAMQTAHPDRPTSIPGGVDCQECGAIFTGEEWHSECGICHAKGAFEAACTGSVVLSLLTALEEAQSGLHGVMEAGRQEIALLRARAEKAEQQAAALMNAINKTIPLLEDEGVGWIARPLIAARDKPLADVLGAALSPNKSEADNA